MTPTMVMILMMVSSAGLRALLGTRHPVALVPLIAACGVWIGETSGSRWQWAFLILGAALLGLTIWFAVESLGRRRLRSDLG